MKSPAQHLARGKIVPPMCTIHIESVYNTHMDSKELIKQLERSGWTLRGVKGSHHVFTHPDRPGHISVPHPKKDLGIGLLNSILKAAGLK